VNVQWYVQIASSSEIHGWVISSRLYL